MIFVGVCQALRLSDTMHNKPTVCEEEGGK